MSSFSAFRFSCAALSVALVSSAAGAPVAFPGAEGFGRFASGGRGGDVYVVTNLNNSGAGSLREAVTVRTASPRTVVFAVSGTIYLQSSLRITQGNLTLAGQTAPGDGICLAHYPLDPSNSSNVIIRFLRSRLGDASGVENDAFGCRYATNVIVDHCSFSWSVDETASSYDNTNFTMQWCIVSESLRDSVHSKGPHGYGAIWGGLGATYHHNLIAHHDSRNPRFNGARTHGTAGELVDMRNNIIYNWKGNSTYGGEPTDAGLPSRQNVVNNYYKQGPATGTGSIRYRVLNPSPNDLSPGSLFGLFHVNGNYTSGSTTVTADNWSGGVQGPTAAELTAMRADIAFVVAPVATQTAIAAYPLVLAYVGCRLPAVDAVDARIVSEVATGTAAFRGSKGNYPGIIDSQADVGGWPVLVSLPAPTDSDSDGMPDAWETARGLNPASPADRNLTDAEGYTRLENYLNSLATAAFPVPTVTVPPTSVAVALGATLTLTVAATGVGDLSYQWYKDGSALVGQVAAAYSASPVTTADLGSYTVVVTNAYGSTPSLPAVVSSAAASEIPSISSPPVSLQVVAGQPAAFQVVAAGSAPLAYQWYRGNAQLISGATSASHTIPAAVVADAGTYYVVVTNAGGAATSAAATLTVTPSAGASVFATTFAADTIHAAVPALTASATNWYVFSSKNATLSAVGDNPATTGVVDTRLDLTMAITTSGVVEATAFFAEEPRILATVGDVLRARIVFVPTNVKTVGLGFFNSGGVRPYTGLINGQLVGNTATLATGGTQLWRGYRGVASIASTVPTVEARAVQNGLSNASQSLIIPGTSSSAPSVVAIGTLAPSPTVATFVDGQTYTLSAALTRSAPTAFTFAYTVHAGTDTTATALFSASGTTTAAGALPAEVTSSFDAIGLGYRNVGSGSVSHLAVTSLRVDYEPLVAATDPYADFLASHGLSASGAGGSDGAPTADPDGDGLPNALEFVLGGSPVDLASAPVPRFTVEAGGQGAFAFNRRIDAADDFQLSVEQSVDLFAWMPLTDGVGGVAVAVTPLDSEFELVVLRAPLGGTRSFFRLRATER